MRGWTGEEKAMMNGNIESTAQATAREGDHQSRRRRFYARSIHQSIHPSGVGEGGLQLLLAAQHVPKSSSSVYWNRTMGREEEYGSLSPLQVPNQAKRLLEAAHPFGSNQANKKLIERSYCRPLCSRCGQETVWMPHSLLFSISWWPPPTLQRSNHAQHPNLRIHVST